MSDVALTCVLGGSSQDVFVSSGFLRLRQRGNWTAYVESSNTVAPTELSPASLLVRREDGSADTFTGAVRRAKANPGNQKLAVTVVGGAGKLIFPLPPLDHVLGSGPIPAGVVARAICDAAGEQLAPGVEAALDATLLPRWHRATDTTPAIALDLLAHQLQVPWRVLPSGLVWMGVETWSAVDGAAYWTGLVEDDGAVTYAPRGAPYLPGQTIDGVRAIDVRYDVGAALTCEIRGAVTGDPPHVPDLDLYRGSYSATVVAQNPDGTIDVRCDDARIGELRRLLFRVGLPGASATFDPTTAPPPRVRVRFDGASPAGAFAEGADQDFSDSTDPSSPVIRAVDTAGRYAFDPGIPGSMAPALYYQAPGASVLTPVTMLTAGSTAGGTVPSLPGSTFATTIALGPGSTRVKFR